MLTDPTRLPWHRMRAGVVLVAALAVAALAVFFLDEVERELSEGPQLLVAATQASNLEPGAEVWVAGVPAGRVLAIHFRAATADTARRVLIRTVLERDAADLLRSDASAIIRESALLAPSVVAVLPGEGTTPYDFSDTLRAQRRIGADLVLARADSLRDRLASLRPLAERLRARLSEGPGTLAALRRDSALAVELGARLARARDWAGASEDGTAALLGRDSALAGAWDRIGARADTLRRAAPVDGIAALDRALVEVGRRLDSLERRLQEPRGTAGRLLHDGALERERREMEARLDSVRMELMADPLRWLRIRLF